MPGSPARQEPTFCLVAQLYSSHIETWKRQQQEGLTPKKRGRKPDASREHKDELASLRKQNARLEKQLQQAQIIIEIQKKVSSILGLPPSEDET